MKNLYEASFVREKIYSADQSAFKKYMSFVVGDTSLFAFLRYELITLFLGSIPGALGLVLRKKFYPSLFKTIGKGVIFGRNITLRHPDKIKIGDNVVIDDYALLDGRGAGEEGVVIGSNTIIGRNVLVHSKVGPISIGENCNIGTSSIIVSQGGIEIAAGVQIAGGCEISGGLFRFEPQAEGDRFFSRYTKGPVIIKEKCFIGGFSTIQDGVTVGKCSMIGTGAVVMNNIPEYSIYIPRPGMIIGKTVTEPEKENKEEAKPHS